MIQRAAGDERRDACKRFYARQFETRAQANGDVVIRFEAFLRDYVERGRLAREGMPSVRSCAQQVKTGMAPSAFRG